MTMLRCGMDLSIFSSDGKERRPKRQRYVGADAQFKSCDTLKKRIQNGRERPKIRTRLVRMRPGATQPSDERDGRSKGCIPVAQSLHVKMSNLQQRLQLSLRVTAIRIDG